MMELVIAGAIFFGFPLLFVIYTGWLVFTERTEGRGRLPARRCDRDAERDPHDVAREP